MVYVKYFHTLPSEVEEVLNEYLQEVEAKGHRVMSSKFSFYTMSDNNIGVHTIFAITDQQYPHGKRH